MLVRVHPLVRLPGRPGRAHAPPNRAGGRRPLDDVVHHERWERLSARVRRAGSARRAVEVEVVGSSVERVERRRRRRRSAAPAPAPPRPRTTRSPPRARRRARARSDSSHLCSSTSQYAWTRSRSGRRRRRSAPASAGRPRAASARPPRPSSTARRSYHSSHAWYSARSLSRIRAWPSSARMPRPPLQLVGVVAARGHRRPQPDGAAARPGRPRGPPRSPRSLSRRSRARIARRSPGIRSGWSYSSAHTASYRVRTRSAASMAASMSSGRPW